MDIYLSKENIYRAVIPLYFLLLFLKFFIGADKAAINIIVSSLVIFLGILTTVIFFTKQYFNTYIFKFISFLFVCSCINFIYSPNYRIQDLFLVFSYTGIALVPLFVKLNYKFYKWVLVVVLVYFLYMMYKETDPNDVFNVSRNFVSVFLLIVYGLHIISSIQNNKNPSFLFLIISFAISIWAVGRGGILAFGYLVLFYPLVVKSKLRVRLLILCLYVVSSIYIYNKYNEYILKVGFARFQTMGIQDTRTDINSDYIKESKKSLSNFLFGSPLKDIPSIVEVEGNPHNSFIRLHVYYGIFGFTFMILTLIYSAYRLFIKKQYILLYFTIALLLRSATDSAAFHGALDPLIYFAIFFAIKDISFTKQVELS